MITTSRLHRHEFDLLPPDAGEVISVMVEFFDKNTTVDESPLLIETFASTHHRLKLAELFNFSLTEAIDIIVDHKRKVDQVFTPRIETILIVSYAALVSWGLISNCLLCYVVTRQCIRKAMPHNGPSPRNLYIVNLAVADLLLCVICMPFTLLSLLRRRWTLGPVICKLVPIIQGSNVMVSSGTITAIAFDRYFTIVRSPNRTICQCSATTSLAVIWLISFLSMLPLVAFQRVESVKLGDFLLYEVCLERWPSSDYQKIYTMAIAVTQFMLPVIALTVIHLKISLYLKVHLNGPPKSILRKRGSQELRRNRRTMYILSCIAIVFTLSWLPLTLFTVVVEFEFYRFAPNTLYLVFVVCHILAMSSACTNPLLYGYLNTNFRRDLNSLYYAIFNIEPAPRKSTRRKRNGSQVFEGKQIRAERKSANTTEPLSVVVKSRDRRTSSSFGTTLTTTFRTRSSSCGVAQPKVDEL